METTKTYLITADEFCDTFNCRKDLLNFMEKHGEKFLADAGQVFEDTYIDGEFQSQEDITYTMKGHIIHWGAHLRQHF